MGLVGVRTDTTLGRGDLLPFSLEGLASRLDCLVYVCCLGVGDIDELLASGGVDCLEGLAVLRLDPLVVT